MKLTDADLRELVREGSARPGGRRASCPAESDLAGVATGEADAAVRGRVVAHLPECAECAEEYRLACAVDGWARDASGALAPPRVRERPAGRYWAQALAAAWVLTAFGLGSWAVSLRQQNRDLAAGPTAPAVEELRARLAAQDDRSRKQEAEIAALQRAAEESAAPQLNVPIVDLEPDTTRGASDTAAKTVEVPDHAAWMTLVLTSAAPPRPDGYEVEIVGPDGRPVWTGKGLRRTLYGTFTLAVPRRLLPAGQYRIRLYAPDQQTRRLVEEYPVRISVR